MIIAFASRETVYRQEELKDGINFFREMVGDKTTLIYLPMMKASIRARRSD